jgi:hypothetical protein
VLRYGIYWEISMTSRTTGLALIVSLLFAAPLPLAAKTIDVPIHWSIQKEELSIARLRLYAGPRIRKDICGKMGASLRAGNTVRVTIYGAGKQVLTAFTYTARDCK